MKDITESVLYRDALILVINKPSGLAVHASGKYKGKTLTNYLPDLCFGLPKIPQLAHRLDRMTTGCLILGRHRQALIKLEKLFKNNEVDKRYIALVYGRLPKIEGEISLPLSQKSKSKNNWQMQVDTNGQEAITHYKVLASNDDISLVDLHPITGRTHQLRVHMQAMNCPIIGDPIYFEGTRDDGPMMLHSYSVSLKLYPKKPEIVALAPIPDYFSTYLHGGEGQDIISAIELFKQRFISEKD